MKTNTLVVLAVVVVAFALFNLIVTFNKAGDLTGYATAPTGEANLTVLTQININFSVDSIEWGSGSVDTTWTFANLNSEGTNYGATVGTFWQTNPVSQGLVLDNLGNTDVNVTFSSNKDADAFIGGSSPSPTYEWRLTDPGTSCTGTITPLAPTNYVTVTTPGELSVCSNFTQGNSLTMDVNITIPSNSPAVFKTSIITASAYIPAA